MWIATINQAGYMPDKEPEEFEAALDAWKYLLAEREYDLECNVIGADDETLDQLRDAAEHGGSGFLVDNKGLCYEVQYVQA